MTCDGSQNKPFPYVARIIDKYCSIAHIAYSAIKTRLNLPKTHIEYSLGRAEPCVPKRHVLVFFCAEQEYCQVYYLLRIIKKGLSMQLEKLRKITMPSWCTSTFAGKRVALGSVEAGTIIPAVLTPFPWRTSCKARIRDS